MSLQLETPESFPAFPFLPYDIQLDLMRHLYSAIEGRKVTIVESPTGTGKTLSLLCASLTWLRDEQDRARRGKLDASSAVDGDWVLAQTLDRRRRELEMEEQAYAERLLKARQKEAVLRKASKGRVRKRMKMTAVTAADEQDTDDAAFLPDDIRYEDDADNISPAVRALMQKLQKSGGTQSPDSEVEPTCTKIFYASRTHSQLSQVLHELHKLKISLVPPPKAPVTSSVAIDDLSTGMKRTLDEDAESDQVRADTRTVSLGSRKQLCIHDKLKARAADLDESCRQLLSEKGDRRCPYLPPSDDEARMFDLRDQILAIPKDIEELVESGQNSETCPYFGTRKAIPQAQLVLLPYNLLLQKSARESLGIDLTNQVVIVDEAHNLISTLLSLSAAHLPLRTLSTSLRQLSLYLSKFKNRLTTEHALHLKRLVGFLEALQKYAEQWAQEHGKSSPSKPEIEVMTSGELLRRLGRKVEGINLLEVEAYLRKSRIARKISGYCVKEMEKTAGEDPAKLAKLMRLSSTNPPLHTVENFIIAITAANDDGRVTLSVTAEQIEIKYQHLNPSTQFREVVEAARAIILAGGTMSPISDVTNQLFAQLPNERLSTFSCGHIIPSRNLQTLIVKKGPRGGELQFKYDQRNNQNVIAELGQILLNFSAIVPGGMVVFFPSYSFLHLMRDSWEKSGAMDKLRSKKKVFMEPQDSSEVETVLRDYAAGIQGTGSGAKGGSLLFAVVGAKLSEGLNFTDDLARAVVIVGLPFANLASPELRERMDYVKRLEQKRGIGKAPGAKDAGTELYENLCMNAVNQSIGRAIRHKGDWASLVLIDGRYASSRIRNKLPQWIGSSTAVTETFGEAMKEMGRFFREKRSGS